MTPNLGFDMTRDDLIKGERMGNATITFLGGTALIKNKSNVLYQVMSFHYVYIYTYIEIYSMYNIFIL